MDKVYVVFSVERDNPFETRSIVGMADIIEAARHMASLNEDSFIQCVIEVWDVKSLYSLDNKVPWNVTLWNTVDTVCVKRVNIREGVEPENKIIINDYDSYMVLVWAASKDEAIEEARRIMLNERSN